MPSILAYFLPFQQRLQKRLSPFGVRLAAGCLTFVIGSSSVLFAQKPPAETIASLQPAEGFEVKLFAAEPMVVNPIAIDVDTYGRVWVTEGTKYRKNVADPPDDKIKVLEDTDGDGVADKMTVFTGDLNAAMGICVAGSKIYVAESPHLYLYEDKNNDLVPDGPRTVFLTGFGGKNHDHGTHSQVFGPDHKLYMTNGDTGYDVTGPDGRNIKFKWGGMIRCEADGTQLEDFAVNFRNPVELAVDSFGNVWCSDNDNDGLKSVRICWILEGGNYGWFGGPENIRNPDGSFDPIHHWRADKPGFVPYVLITGFGSPCGMTFYEHDSFGPKYKSKIIHCDAGPREIRCYDPQRLKGIGYTATLENIVTSSDNYFRPVDPCVAPDGSIYVSDWYDGGVGGHAYNDPSRGRIYRLTPKGKTLARKGKPGPYVNDSDALEGLRSPNLATQFLARERLLASGEKALESLVNAIVLGGDLPFQARCLWVVDRIGGRGRDVVLHVMKTADPPFQSLAVRILRRHGDEYTDEILKFATNRDLAGDALTEVLLTAGKSSNPAATAFVLKAFDGYDGSDRYLLETLGIAARGREAEVFQKVVDRPGAVVSPRLVNIVRILRPDDATKWLSSKLSAPDLSPDVAETLLSALGAFSTAEAGQSVLALLTGTASDDVKKLALDALRRNLSGPWNKVKDEPVFREAIEKSLSNRSLKTETIVAIRDAGLEPFAADVLRLLKEDRLAGEALPPAVDVFVRFNVAGAPAELARRLKRVEKRPAEATDALVRGIVALRDTAVISDLLNASSDVSTGLKRQIAEQVAASSDGAVLLLRLIDTKRLPKDLADRVVALSVEHPDVNVRLLFEKFIPAAERPKTLGQSFKASDILALKGDASRGAAVFLRSGAASCNKCHRVKGNGSDIGPDLSQIGRKYERQALLETIMNPSAGIAPEYVPYVVETERGKVYAGFLHEQNDERVVLKTIEGAAVQIPRKEVVELVKQEKSLMPELVLKSVTAQDAADLLAYLVSLQETMVHASTFKVVGPFPNMRPEHRGEVFGPEKAAGAIDESAEYEGRGKKVRWTTTTAKPGPAGFPAINLAQVAAELKGRADNVIYYFAATLESASAQPATLYVGSDDGIQVWLNGQKVHDKNAKRALKPGEDKVAVELKAGRNLVLLKLDQSDGDAGLTLSAEARAILTFGVP
jgi:putative membrane-bound dehydrogenase-like protein